MKTIVTTPKDSKEIVIISKNNPYSAAIMLRSETQTVNDQGFIQTEVRVGLVKGKLDEIRKIAAGLKAGDDYSAKVMPVKLVVKEALEPFYNGQQPKINPQTKETVTHLGAPVYRQTLVVSESSAEVDVKLATDREPVQAEIKADRKAFEAKKS